jgi:hypothetical protein
MYKETKQTEFITDSCVRTKEVRLYLRCLVTAIRVLDSVNAYQAQCLNSGTQHISLSTAYIHYPDGKQIFPHNYCIEKYRTYATCLQTILKSCHAYKHADCLRLPIVSSVYERCRADISVKFIVVNTILLMKETINDAATANGKW